ncbi:DNA processing protein DprA [Advenella kashmirensis W13003]|uniref:DNA processing protein DprA n=1 Tax=Advenella kashmirensis W13003 TaxID=1424334 RepID=V8QW97_9BURK|nr:DNA-processing protein DprA [Advenella kashmirensis]ETF03289.1 DNA processing protein DprA [Advenella kashmirensis W13003]
MAMSDEERYAWVRLTLEPGIGPVTARHLLVAFGLPQDIFSASASSLMKVVTQKQALQLAGPVDPAMHALIERTFEWLARPGHHLVTLADDHYPALLLDTADPPSLLYVDGDPGILAQPNIAMVGARSATPGGTDNAFAFARHLADAGWGIVSGLAQGIDAAAHEGALASSAALPTIAVMGTGINRVYPAANKALAMRIRERGALISELPLDTAAVVHQFPRRNRIVAGLSRGVLVVEAAQRSGSLITARLAGENGREVFAIPGSIHSPLSRGCHALIRQGAKLVETADDILEELSRSGSAPVAPTPVGRKRDTSRNVAAGDPPAQARVARPPVAAGNLIADPGQQRLLDTMGHDPVSMELLLVRLGISVGELAGQLTELEMLGKIVRLPDGRYLQRVNHLQ